MLTSHPDDDRSRLSSLYDLFSHRFVKVVAFLITAILTVSGGDGLLSLAQAPAAFVITVIPEADYAVAGQPFTYTIVMTNISQLPVEDVIVFTETPSGTTFIETHRNAEWLFGGPQPGETGALVWNTLEPVASAQVVTFDLVVKVLPEMVNQPLVSQEYTLLAKGNSTILGTGPPITTQVLATRPTVTPTSPPTATTTATPKPTSTDTPSPTPTTTTTPTRQLPTPTADTVTPTPVTQSPPKTTSRANASLPAVTLAVIGVAILVFGALGLTWLLKRR